MSDYPSGYRILDWMNGRTLTPGMSAYLVSGVLAASPLTSDLSACRDFVDDARRLSCYDALADALEGEVFRGKGSGVTPEFEVTSPRLMSFESEDVIMVLYLLDAQDRVVQNLHRGGAGGGSYLIEKPGRYHVQVNASGGWQVRVAAP